MIGEELTNNVDHNWQTIFGNQVKKWQAKEPQLRRTAEDEDKTSCKDHMVQEEV